MYYNGLAAVTMQISCFFKDRKMPNFDCMKMSEKKNLAQSLYVKSDFTRKQIAANAEVTEKTLRKWINDGDWDKMKDALQVTRPQLLVEAYAQLKAVNEKIRTDFGNVPTKDLSDAKGVLRKEIETLSSQPIHKYIEVFEDFIQFLSKSQPKELSKWASLSQSFINELVKER